MARISGVDIPNNKRGEIALTYIYGIGRKSAQAILVKAGIDLNKKAGQWTNDESTKIRNIISNALKFSNPQGEIVVDAHAVDDKIILSFQDSGIGMTQQEVMTLFQTKPTLAILEGTRSESGMGLGLKLSRDYLLRMGSDIEVTSKIGVGTTMSIILQKA